MASLWRGSTSRHRLMSLRRLGHDVVPFDMDPYIQTGGRLSQWLRYRAMIGPTVARFNRDLIAVADGDKFDLAWFERPVFLWPRTLKIISERVIQTVQHNTDNPFGSRGDPGWRLFLKALPLFDVNLVPRKVSIAEYKAAGAQEVIYMHFAYDPAIHFPPPDRWSDSDRPYDVSFTGSPYDRRPDLIRALWRHHGIRVGTCGSRWDRVFTRKERDVFYDGPAAYNEAYRERIWGSKINLGFLTHSNNDQTARRWFEIAACGGFLLAERSAHAGDYFVDGREAAFFSSVDECAALIRRYLPDEAARAEIARAGHDRAVSSGYGNDARLGRVLSELAAARKSREGAG